MTNERTNDVEFQNVLNVASKSDLSNTAKALIVELFERVKEIEARSAARDELLRSIVDGMNHELEKIGSKPDKAELRDGFVGVTTALRDLAQELRDPQAGR